MRKKSKKKQTMIDTIVGPNTVIEGEVTHPTSIRIDGQIYGEVECNGDVYIGKEGYVETCIKAQNIIIAGEVNGDLQTTEKVHIQSSGKLSGTTTTKGMVIEDGGIFNGESTIVQDSQLEKKSPEIYVEQDTAGEY